MISIIPECPQQGQSIEALYDRCFGAARYNKASYSLRVGVAPVRSCARVIIDQSQHEATGADRVIGAVRFWEVDIQCLVTGRLTGALFLGPFAIDPAYQGQRLGHALMTSALQAVDQSAFGQTVGLILLVGDMAYYNRFGFEPMKPRTITLPGGRDADRLLYRMSTGMCLLPSVGVLKRKDQAARPPVHAAFGPAVSPMDGGAADAIEVSAFRETG